MMQIVITNNLLLWLAIPAYWLAWASLLRMALDCHVTVVDGGAVEVYPTKYFIWLIVQLLPLVIAGFVCEDAFIIATRLPLILCVGIAFVMTEDGDGRFGWNQYGKPIMALLIILSTMSMAWMKIPAIAEGLKAHSVIISYLALIGMLLYIPFGQGSTMKKLWTHMEAVKTGLESRMKGLDLQICRFSGFALPAVHYGLSPEHGVTNAFFLQSAAGALGSATIIVLYLMSTPKGIRKRR